MVLLAVSIVLPGTFCACCADAHHARFSWQDTLIKLALLVFDSHLLTSKGASAGVVSDSCLLTSKGATAGVGRCSCRWMPARLQDGNNPD